MEFRALRFSILLPLLVTMIAALTACGYSPMVSEEARERAAAVDCEQVTCVDFIYVHGASTHTESDRQFILGRVDVLHEALAAALYDTPEFVEGALQGGKLAIAPEARLYFWGGDIALVRDIETLEAIMEAQERREGRAANKFYAKTHRRLAEAIHDLFWAADPSHRFALTDSLHAFVRESRGRGRKVVLVGYSAGAVVITTYGVHRLRGIVLDELGGLIRGSEVLPELFAGRQLRTCGEALLSSGLVETDDSGLFQARLEDVSDEGDFDLDYFRDAYWRSRLEELPELTRRYCLDEDTLVGGITFGSMATLLLSKTNDAQGEMRVLADRQLVRSGQFWLNVNHADDLVALNVYEEVDIIQRLERNLGLEPVDGDGFYRSAEPEFRGANFINAHRWYLREPRQFSALVADTYARGYRERRDRREATSIDARDAIGSRDSAALEP